MLCHHCLFCHSLFYRAAYIKGLLFAVYPCQCYSCAPQTPAFLTVPNALQQEQDEPSEGVLLHNSEASRTRLLFSQGYLAVRGTSYRRERKGNPLPNSKSGPLILLELDSKCLNQAQKICMLSVGRRSVGLERWRWKCHRPN